MVAPVFGVLSETPGVWSGVGGYEQAARSAMRETLAEQRGAILRNILGRIPVQEQNKSRAIVVVGFRERIDDFAKLRCI